MLLTEKLGTVDAVRSGSNGGKDEDEDEEDDDDDRLREDITMCVCVCNTTDGRGVTGVEGR